MKRLLFRRDFRTYYGGHGKVWDYYRHAMAHPGWEPRIHFTADSIAQGNPWRESDAPGLVPEWDPDRHDALFLAGMDWACWPKDRDGTPVINLVQHVRHADANSDVGAFLERRAIRVCVSGEIVAALRMAGVRGPVLCIDAALDIPPGLNPAQHRAGIAIGATKQPALGRALALDLRALGFQVALIDASMPRRNFLSTLAGAKIAVLLPHEAEGFYLPALEAMALGCATVVPDCVGNRAYARDGSNALVPAYTCDALLAAVQRIACDEALSTRLSAEGQATAAGFTQAREREAFHALLDDLPALWAAA